MYNGHVSLTACSDLSAADWITDSDLSSWQLVTLGPSGFAAYARLRFLPDPAYEGQSENDVVISDDAPLESAQLAAVLEVLSRHTRTPDECYFCVWDGWGPGIEGVYIGESMLLEYSDDGDVTPGFEPTRAQPGLAPASPSSESDLPKVVVPNRAYFLFRGAPSDLGDLPDPAAFIWPADRSWCVAHDVDPHWAGIGADTAAIDELVSVPRLDVVRTDPGAPQPFYR